MIFGANQRAAKISIFFVVVFFFAERTALDTLQIPKTVHVSEQQTAEELKSNKLDHKNYSQSACFGA